jgi:phage terminase large subunit
LPPLQGSPWRPQQLKSHSFAGALLTLGIAQDLRILCAREIQKSLAQSVHQLLQDKIEALGITATCTT